MRMFRKDSKAVSPVIAIILMVAITVVLASVLYVWVTSFLDQPPEPVDFAKVELTLKDDGSSDSLMIKHVSGNPIEWSSYKIILTNNTDESQTTLTRLNDLGYQSFGETVKVNSTIAGFSDIDYEKGKTYQLEIYDLSEHQRVYNKENLICE